MRVLGLLTSFAILADCVCSVNKCSYQALFEHLGLDKSNNTLTSIRPVRDWRNATIVYMDLYLNSIIDVDAKAQSFSPKVLISMGWKNSFTSWNPDEFCGISIMSIPRALVWMPDVIVKETAENQASMRLSPYVHLFHFGMVSTEDSYTMTTSCQMDLNNFPFDIQRCNLTLMSALYEANELQIRPFSNSTILTASSRKNFQTKGEWDLLSITMTKSNAVQKWDELVYMVTMRRSPLLYVINFLIPIFCFLVMDIASFFIDDSSGEKLSFKVTILLSVSVLLLMLQDMLPSTPSRLPLIGVYVTVAFAFMALGVLETILVNFLKSQDKQNDGRTVTSSDTTEQAVNSSEHQEGSVMAQGISPATVLDPDGGGVCTASSLKLILMEVQALQQRCSTVASGRRERRPQRWSRVARIIDISFFWFYLIGATTFLVLMHQAWCR